jgi:3-oxoacyl-[acyl-carrier protein] reductase
VFNLSNVLHIETTFNNQDQSMFSLKEKKALITGATGGIGRVIAENLARQGADVVLTGTRQEVLDEVAAHISATYGVKAIPMVCALNDAAACDALFEKAEAAVGPIDILVNNAGITRDTLLMRMKDEDWQAVLDVNLTSMFRLCRAAVKGMMKRRYGRIINMSSVVGSAGNPGQTNYCASKAGMIGFSKSLAQEVATRGITVNCVAPGFIETAMTDVLPDAVKTKILSGVPQGKLGTSDDIAAAVVYLASTEAGYVTGQTLHINGGMLMV